MVEPTRRIVLRAELHAGGGCIVAHTLELDGESAFVQTDVLPPVGETVRLRLSFPGLVEPVELQGRVSAHRLALAPGEPRGVQIALQLETPAAGMRFDALLRRVRTTPPAEEGPAAAPYRVLLVDDNGIIRDMFAYGVKKYFQARRSHVTVDVAENGMEAWEKLSAAAYDLAIVDYYLPVMNGSELIARLRQETRHSRLPVVAISVGGEAAREASLAAGADLFLDKPIVLRDLFSTLDRLTATREAAR